MLLRVTQWGHHIFAQVGAQRVGNCLSILPLILGEETACNERPDLVLVQRYRDALLTGLAPPAVTSHALGARGEPRQVLELGHG
jgi:hypothetical protein